MQITITFLVSPIYEPTDSIRAGQGLTSLKTKESPPEKVGVEREKQGRIHGYPSRVRVWEGAVMRTMSRSGGQGQ